jgi:hypothetical protein
MKDEELDMDIFYELDDHNGMYDKILKKIIKDNIGNEKNIDAGRRCIFEEAEKQYQIYLRCKKIEKSILKIK